jgi:hypothetical protein
MKAIATVAMFVALMTACSSNGPSNSQVQTAHASPAVFTNFRSFAFRPAGSPGAPFDVSARSFEVERRMRPLVEAELEGKGYTEAATFPKRVAPDRPAVAAGP